MLLETYNQPWDFELLDTGGGFRLEKWGEAILARPDPQIIWQRSLPDAKWDKAWAVFQSPSDGDKGRWDIKKSFPNPWNVSWHEVKFKLRPSPFKHTGLFAEQAINWEWMMEKISNFKFQISNDAEPGSKIKDKELRILNLFAYTGGATMVLAKAGCNVTHVDASKPAITWANENYKLNFGAVGAALEPPVNQGGSRPSPTQPSVRWILDDAVKFVKREIKRGAKYDGIIMDPPAFGHSPTGKTWKFNDDLPGLLADCVRLLSDDAKFLIINGYATNSSALSLNNLLEDAINSRDGQIQFGELCLKQKNNPDAKVGVGRLISTGIFARWSN